VKIKTLCALVLLLLGASFASAQTVTRCGGPSTALQVNWSTFLFDECRTGYNAHETKLNTGNVQNLVVAWRYTLNTATATSPVVVNNVAYFGDNSGNVTALDAHTGVQIWQYTTGGIIGGSPAIANGVLYVGSWDHNVYALDASTGALLWKYATVGPVNASPAVVNGTVYVGGEFYMDAFNAKTGALLWQCNIQSQGISTAAAVVNGVVYFGTNVGNLYAVSAGNGTLLWKTAAGYNNPYGPTVINGILYFTPGYQSPYLYAYDALTGTVLWKAGPDLFTPYDIAIANGILYMVGGSEWVPTMYAYNAKTGTQLWSSTLPDIDTSGVVVANGVLYSISNATEVYTPALLATDASNGNFLARYDLSSNSAAPPAIANGYIYVGGGGFVTAFHLPSQ
jgi:eukaryotic-like serine/threonine-protein kinase